MQKLKTKALTIMLLMTMALAIYPLVNASTGYILINTTTSPSTPGQKVAAGGDVNLYVGGVTWSGGQLYLLMSKDGFSQVSTGDLRFTPTFNLANVTADAVSNYTNVGGFTGTWLVGYDWINGTIAREIAGGNYFIKAFDGTATSVAVTDTYITVIASLEVVPTEGPGGASITLKGYAFLANDKVNLTYYDPIEAEWVTIASLVSTNSLGQFNYSMSAPDLMQALPAGDSAEDYDIIIFEAVENSTANDYTADFNEWQRGLVHVDGEEATVGLYGDLTDLSASVLVGVFEEVIVAGKWFHPGNVSFLWDGVTNIGTTTANQTGFFNKTITIPETSVGAHNLTVKDATSKFFVAIYVTPTLVLVPEEGPVTTVVTAKGYGFPAPTTGTAYNATLTWYGAEEPYIIAWALTDSAGKFITTFTVPHDYGGEHDVVAVTNDTDLTTATGVFTITPRLRVEPATFKVDGSVVKAIGDGFRLDAYMINIDNQWLGTVFLDEWVGVIPNATGDLIIEFVAAGFRPGWHVMTAYWEGDPEHDEGIFLVAAKALFNVTSEGDPIADILKACCPVILEIRDNVATLMTDVGTIKVDVATIKGWQPVILEIKDGVATIKTDIGTLKADVAALKPVVTEIKDGVATVKTDLGTVKGKVESIDGSVATVKSDVGTIKADVSQVKSDVSNVPGSISGVTTPIWIAVILSLIAAIAAIVGVLQIRRKIAG